MYQHKKKDNSEHFKQLHFSDLLMMTGCARKYTIFRDGFGFEYWFKIKYQSRK